MAAIIGQGRRRMVMILMTLMLVTTGCRPLAELPGFQGIPMHPKGAEVSRSKDSVSYWLRGVEQDSVLDFYLRQMKRNRWTLVEQWGGALLYRREGRKVLLTVSQVAGDTNVAVVDNWEPRRFPD